MNNETRQNELLNSNFIQANPNANHNLGGENPNSSSFLTQSPPVYPNHFSIGQEQKNYGVFEGQSNATSNNVYQNQQTIPVTQDGQYIPGYNQNVPLQQQENAVQETDNNIGQTIQPMQFIPPVQNGSSLEGQPMVQKEQSIAFTKPVDSFTEMPFAGVNQQEEKEQKIKILPNGDSLAESENKTLEALDSSNMQPIEKKTDANAGLKFLFVIFVVLLIAILCLPLIGLN